MQVDNIKKEPSECYAYALNYQDEYKGAEVFTSVKVTAEEVLTGADVTATFLGNSGGPPPDANFIEGTTTSGNLTTLTDTTKDFAAEGIEIGHEFYNVTQKWRAKVIDIKTTTNPYDTLVFEAQTSPAAASDVYKFYLAKAVLINGTDTLDYKVTWRATSSTGRKHEDSIKVQVRDF